jgi:hypothetical protein
VQVISEPLPSKNLLDRETRVTVSERQEEVPASNNQRENDTTSDPSTEHALASESLTGGNMVPGADGTLLVLDLDLLRRLRVEDEFKKGTGNKTRSEMGGKVMMQEKLSSHEEEWEVVGGPSQEEETSRVVHARAST